MIALYSRVSTAEQARDGYSIGEQQERLTAYCRARGWSDFQLFTDAGYSGGNMNRPALQELLASVKNGTVTRVIVYKLDRLSRSQKDILQILEDIFQPNGVDFISLSESIQLDSAFGRAMLGVMGCFAQLEREQIRERVTLGREARAKDGRWVGGGVCPIGYEYIDGHLIVNEFEAMQIREAHRLCQHGHGYVEIADSFTRKGWVHKYGQWTGHQIRQTLTNRLYVGMVSFAGTMYNGIHTPIVDEETFEKTAKMMRKNYKKHRAPVHDAFLVGKIWCARCGARYSHAVSHSGHKADAPRISYYNCKDRLRQNPNRSDRCTNTVHRCDAVDGAVFDELRQLVIDDVVEYRQDREEPNKVKMLRKELAKVDAKRSRLIDLYAVGGFSAVELKQKIDPLTESRTALERQIAALDDLRPMDAMKHTIDSIGGILDAGDPVMIRQLIDVLIDRVEIDGDDITIFWNFD